jgi:hypothetical protein
MSSLKIYSIAEIIIFLLLATTAQCFGIDKQMTRELYKGAGEANKNLPVMMSDEILLERIYVRDDNELVYVMKSIKFDKNQFEALEILKSTAAKKLCSNPDTVKMLENGIKYTHVLYDKNDNFGYEYSITEKDCSSPANNSRSTKKDFIDSLPVAAGEISKNLPMMVDKETRIDSLSATNGTMIFVYTLVNINAEDLTKDMKTFLYTQAVNGYCSALGDAKAYRENGVTIKLNYRGMDGKFAAYISVSPADCKKD